MSDKPCQKLTSKRFKQGSVQGLDDFEELGLDPDGVFVVSLAKNFAHVELYQLALKSDDRKNPTQAQFEQLLRAEVIVGQFAGNSGYPHLVANFHIAPKPKSEPAL